MNMLDEVAAETARMAEAQTQPEGRDAEADNMEIDSSTKVAGRDRLQQLVKMVGQKDERSGLMLSETPSLKERLQGMDLMKQAKQLDRIKITVSICHSK